jgi:Ca2+-binding EF-hand superfamily protein
MEQFRAIDEDQTGLITRDELFKALKNSDLQIDND